MRGDFIAPVGQQLNVPVHQEPMETCQDRLRNYSAHYVTLACTVKEQVQQIHSSENCLLSLFVQYIDLADSYN